MTILLLGATGRTGKWTLAEALSRGYVMNYPLSVSSSFLPGV